MPQTVRVHLYIPESIHSARPLEAGTRGPPPGRAVAAAAPPSPPSVPPARGPARAPRSRTLYAASPPMVKWDHPSRDGRQNGRLGMDGRDAGSPPSAANRRWPPRPSLRGSGVGCGCDSAVRRGLVAGGAGRALPARATRTRPPPVEASGRRALNGRPRSRTPHRRAPSRQWGPGEHPPRSRGGQVAAPAGAPAACGCAPRAAQRMGGAGRVPGPPRRACAPADVPRWHKRLQHRRQCEGWAGGAGANGPAGHPRCGCC